MRLLFLPLLLVLWACANGDSSDPVAKTGNAEMSIPFRIDGTLDVLRDSTTLLTIDIEIADNDSSRQRGMMQRTEFPERTGMLFVFGMETIQQFWMGNTPLSLDLLFIDADSLIVDFSKYAVPFSSKPLISRSPAMYVLEVPAGWIDSNGIVEGDRVRWRQPN